MRKRGRKVLIRLRRSWVSGSSKVWYVPSRLFTRYGALRDGLFDHLEGMRESIDGALSSPISGRSK